MSIIQNLLTPHKVVDKIRIGSQSSDGGYVMSKNNLGNKLISCGCANNTNFEEHYLSLVPDASVEIYDGQSECDLAETDRRVSFHRRNVYTISDLNLTDDCILQMDIEGYEHGIFYTYDESISKIKQMSIELHLNMVGNQQSWAQILNNLNKHHVLIHIHANNYATSYSHGVPSVLEVSYLRKDLIESQTKETVAFPIDGLDVPNNNRNKDIPMSWWLS